MATPLNRTRALKGILILIHLLGAQFAWGGLIPKDSELSGLLSNLEQKPSLAKKELEKSSPHKALQHQSIFKTQKVQRFSIEGPRAPEVPTPRLSDGPQ